MSTTNTLTRKSSFEEFYVADIVDSSKSSASKFLSMQFEKMRENLASAGINPQTSSAPSSATKGVKFNATYNMFGTPVQTPARANPSTSSPAFTVPKPILITTSPPGKIYSRPSSPARSRLPSSEKIKVSTPQNKTPSPPAKNMGVNPIVSLPERPEIIRTLGSPKTSFREDNGTIASVNTFRGLKKVNSGNFQDEVHLHHDVFLATKNDAIAQAVEAISRRRQEVVSRYPQTSGIDYTIRPETKNVQCTVPSHVVTRKASARSQSAPRGSAGMGSRSNSSVRGGIAYSSSSNQSSAHSLAGANIKIPTLQLTPEAVAAGQPRTPINTTNNNTNTTYATLTAKNLALNPAMYRPASAPSTGAKNTLNGESTNSMSNLRISPTTVIDAGEQPKNASPTIKQQRKKFDFNGQGLESPPKPVSVVSSVATSSGGVVGGAIVSGGVSKSMKDGGFVTPARTTSAAILSSTPSTTSKSTPHTTTLSTKYTPKSATAHTTTKSTPKTTPNTTTPTTHTTNIPNKASPSTHSTTTLSNPTSTSKHYRTLTAAEVSAAKALNNKLNAANLAYNRAETANIQPVRTMSRALSQLVYNVRDN